jgi:hypothetical protein
MRDLIIHITGANSEIVGLRPKITYLTKKAFVLRNVQRLPDPTGVISVDARLQRITNLEQLPIAGPEVVTRSANPLQNAAAEVPVPGKTSPSMKACSACAILNLPV